MFMMQYMDTIVLHLNKKQYSGTSTHYWFPYHNTIQSSIESKNWTAWVYKQFI